MKKLMLTVILTFAFSGLALAGACAPASLTTYLVNGYSCTDGNVTFSNFAYSGTATGGAVAIPASGIEVLPGYGTSGLKFDAGWSVGPGEGLDSLIGYTATSSTITGLTLGMAGYGSAKDGIVTVAETTSNGQHLLVYTDSGGTVATDAISFPSVTSLSVTKDITVRGNEAGTATVSAVSNALTTVPEPTALGLFGTGLIGLAGLIRRFRYSA